MALSLSLLGAAPFSGPFTYWLTALEGSAGESDTRIAVDSSDNICVSATTSSDGAGSGDVYLLKYNSVGELQWQSTLGGASAEIAYSIGIDSGDNIVIAGRTQSAGAGSADLLVAKFNSSGVIQWQRVLGGASNDDGLSLALDSLDNIYITGNNSSEGVGSVDLLTVKYNSSGTLQWQRILGGVDYDGDSSIAIDSADDVYIAGRTNTQGEGATSVLIVKYNSSGAIQWQKTLGGARSDFANSLALDSADNLYITGRTDSYEALEFRDDLFLAKLDSAGNFVWQEVYGYDGDSDYGNSITIDSSDNIYIVGQSQLGLASNFSGILLKFNTAGEVQWQRRLTGLTTLTLRGIAVNSVGDLCIGGTGQLSPFDNDILLVKLPADGSLTGNYRIKGLLTTYAASALLPRLNSPVLSTATLTEQAAQLTSATSSLASFSSTLPDFFKGIE